MIDTANADESIIISYNFWVIFPHIYESSRHLVEKVSKKIRFSAAAPVSRDFVLNLMEGEDNEM